VNYLQTATTFEDNKVTQQNFLGKPLEAVAAPKLFQAKLNHLTVLGHMRQYEIRIKPSSMGFLQYRYYKYTYSDIYIYR